MHVVPFERDKAKCVTPPMSNKSNLMNAMNKTLLTIVAALMTVFCVKAQKIQVVDADGTGIPMVSVLSEDGLFIGTTDLDGVLSDVNGARVVSLTHVAYKPKKVVAEHDGRVSLDDADYDLPEIVVANKPLAYVQTYYRIFYLCELPEMPSCYYRAGVLDNYYDRETRTVSVDDKGHFSVSNKKSMKIMFNKLFDLIINHVAGLRADNEKDRLRKIFTDVDLEFVPNGPGKQLVKDKYGVVGSVIDNQEKGERRYNYELHTLSKHQDQAAGVDKKMGKYAQRMANQKCHKSQDFTVYDIDGQGNYSPEDLVMSQSYNCYDDEVDGHKATVNILIQVFTVDRSSVTMDERKQIKKKNKMKMTNRNLFEFERSNNIPALPEVFRKRINEMVKKGK